MCVRESEHMHAHMCAHCGTHVELRGQLVRVSSLLYHVGSGHQSQIIVVRRKCLYLLSQLRGLHGLNLNKN